jgi:hypothetical protein
MVPPQEIAAGAAWELQICNLSLATRKQENEKNAEIDCAAKGFTVHWISV